MKTIFCFLILLLAIAPSLATYDFFKLVLQWPPATCHLPVEKKADCHQTTIKCTKDPKHWKMFTIHGLWPTTYSTPYPRRCPSTTTFKSTLVKSLFPRINNSWPNLFGENDVFWGCQWEKHGTCSESKFKVLDYFKLALDIKDRVHISKAFTDNSILLSHSATYGYSRVVSAIQKHLGHLKQEQVVPELRCRRSKSGAGVYLDEVGLCLDPSGNAFISCPQNDQAVKLCMKGPFKLLPP